MSEERRVFRQHDLVSVNGKEFDVYADERADGNVIIEDAREERYVVQARHLVLVEAREDRHPRCPKCNAYPIWIEDDDSAIFCKECGWRNEVQKGGRA